MECLSGLSKGSSIQNSSPWCVPRMAIPWSALPLPELGLPGMWDDESALGPPGGRLHRGQIAWSAGLLVLKGAGWPGPGYVSYFGEELCSTMFS